MTNDRRVFVAVDVSNIYYCAKMKFGGRRVNYRKLLDRCREYGNVIQATAYAAQLDNQASKFFECLELYGFDVKIKIPKEYGSGDSIKRKADHDVNIAVDMIRQSSRVETIVLCTADGDLLPAVEYVQNIGCRVIIIGCGISNDLKNKCEKTIEIGPSFLEEQHEKQNNVPSVATVTA